MKTTLLPRKYGSLLLLAGLLFGLLSFAPVRAAGPWYVAPAPTGSDSNACTSPASPCATISAALGKPGFAAGDTIRVAVGRYTGSGTEIVLLTKNAVLSGGWDASFNSQTGYSTLDGQLTRQALIVENDIIASVDRFWVENTAASFAPFFSRGGAIVNFGTLTLTRSVVTNNFAGGIHNGDARGSLPEEPEVDTGAMTMSDTVVVHNRGAFGGIYSLGWLTINNSSIADNLTDSNVAGISASGEITINNSTISRNTSVPESTGWGVGVAVTDGSLLDIPLLVRINNSTITQNESGLSISYSVYNPVPVTVRIQNTILSGNDSDGEYDCSAANGWGSTMPFNIVSGGYNIVGTPTNCVFSGAPGEQIGVDPKLGPLFGWEDDQRYNPLLPDSPAINAGNPDGCTGTLGAITVDVRGAGRSDRCDIGAYEYKTAGAPAAIHFLDGSPQHGALSQPFPFPLRLIVSDAAGSPVSNAAVQFAAPAGGPSVVFGDSGTNTITVATDSGGIATSPVLTANDQPGSFQVTAQVDGIAGQVAYSLVMGPWYVRNGGSDEFDCYTPDTACASIGGVFNKADFKPGDTILVGAGSYVTSSGMVVTVNKNAVIRGGWDESFLAQDGWSVLDGENTFRVVTIAAGVEVSFERIIVQNGYTPGDGAGIENFGRLTCSECIIQKNWANHNGGGIISYSGTVTLMNSAVLENSAQASGGIASTGGHLTLSNTTVSGNRARVYDVGGVGASNASLYNSTIAGNIVETGGYSFGGLHVNSNIILHNTLISGNSASNSPDCAFSSPIQENSYNLIGDTTGCGYTPGTGDLLNVESGLASLVGYPLGQRYIPLLASSPAVNAGDPAGCYGSEGPLPTDQRGFARDTHCDIGAYEYTPPGAPQAVFYLSGADQHAVPSRPFLLPLKVYVLDAQGSPVPVVAVTFTAPASGASCTFAGSGVRQESVNTGSDGIASSSLLTANSQPGSYSVTAVAAGIPQTLFYRLGNQLWFAAAGGSDSNTCDRPDRPCATLTGVLARSGFLPGDTVRTAVGNLPAVQITKDLVVSGGWNSSFTAQTGFTAFDKPVASNVYVSFDAGSSVVTADHLLIAGAEHTGISSQNHLTLTNSVIRNNASTGIGLQGTAKLVNVTIAQNLGPGLDIGFQANVAILNSTILDQIDGPAGNDPGSIHTRNSIIADLSPQVPDGDCPANVISDGYNLIENLNCVKISGPGDLYRFDPGFDYLFSSSNYYALSKDSPAINAGDPAGCLDAFGRPLTVDSRGAPRIGRCDIGAFEASPLNLSQVWAGKTTLAAGDTVTYKLILQNNAPVDVPNVSVSNQLPLLMTYVPNSLQAVAAGANIGGANIANGVVQWSGTVRAGVPVEISYQVVAGQVKGPVVNDATITALGDTFHRNLTFNGGICKFTSLHGNPVLPAGPSGAWDQGGVYDPIVLHDGGEYKLYYTGLEKDRFHSGVGLATSLDGIHFTKVGMVMAYGGGYPTRAGTVIKDGGVYHLWYGINSNYFGHATSTDGIHFAGESIKMFAKGLSYGAVQAPHVVKVGELFHMWYTADYYKTGRLAHAISVDGSNWTQDNELTFGLGPVGAWDWLNVDSPHFLHLGDLYQLWYTGMTLPNAETIGVSSSPDGLSWSRPGAATLGPGAGVSDLYGVKSPWVEADSSGYHLWYAGKDVNGIYTINRTDGEACVLAQMGVKPAIPNNPRMYLPLVVSHSATVSITYTDDFSFPNRGWPLVFTSDIQAVYKSGGYRVQVAKANQTFKALNGIYARDFVMEVTATNTSGGDGAFGLLFGDKDNSYDSDTSYNEVIINASRQFTVRSVRGTSIYNRVPLTTSSLINVGKGSVNRIKIIRQGTTLSIYINNQPVYSGGNFNWPVDRWFLPVGLVVHGGNNVSIQFDDFSFTPIGEYDQETFPNQ